MKAIIIATFLFLPCFLVKAQYVAIPDTNFGYWLNHNGFAPCMTGNSAVGWQLDTTCPAVLGDDTSIIITPSFPHIKSVQGLQYFKNLTLFYCNDNSLEIIPSLPPLLKFLQCFDNNLRGLPALPPTLLTLYCSYNRLGSLPTLPGSLTYLSCPNDSLLALPVLPDSLNHLECDYNLLTSLPALPNAITYLSCTHNQLNDLPALPDSLYLFACNDNPLSCLPRLTKVVTLDFYTTNITCLPNAPSDNDTMNPANFPLCASPCYPSGINDLSNNVSLKIYPNPSKDIIYCDCNWGSYNVMLSDVTGRQLPLSVLGNEMNVSALPSGIYYLRLQSVDGVVTKKFTKQ